MFWKSPKRSIIIPAELHAKIARNCTRVEQVPSSVVSVRPGMLRKKQPRELDGPWKPAFVNES